MSRPIAYNASGPLSGSIRGGNVNYTVDSGNRDYTTFASKKWVPSADGAAPIVFVTDTYTQGFELNPNLAVPLFYSCNGTGSAAIIYTANRVPGSPGNYSDANVALNDLITARGYFVLESNDPYQGDYQSGNLLDIDASKMSSYPQTGTSWRDLSGQGNNGTLGSGVTWDSNGWMYFNGTQTTDYQVAIPINRGQLGNNMSVEATFKYDGSSGAGYRPIIGGNDPGLGTEFFLGKNSGNNFFGVQDGNYDGGFVTSPNVFDGNWHHMVYTYDNNTGALYLDGTLRNSGYFSKCNDGEQIYIGAEVQEGYWWNGNISQAKYYTQTLTGTQVKQNYFGAPIVTDGLVFAVDANNLVSYPKSGTAWFNLTGSVASATLFNSPIFTLPNGGAIDFDGTDDYATTPSITISGDQTLCAWGVAEGPPNSPAGVITQHDYASTANFGINYVQNSGYRFGASIGYTNGTREYDSKVTNYTVQEGVVWNVVLVYSSSNNTIYWYVNGQLDSTYALSATPKSTNWPIGLGRWDPSYPAYYFTGKIFNSKIYNRALSAAEIQQNYQAEQYRFETPAGPVTNGLLLYWDAGNLDSYPGTGTTIYDLSGNGNNGTLVNGVGYNQVNGGVLTFDGVDDYVACSGPNLSATNNTVMGASRYSGGVRGRMINATNNNWLMGNWGTTTENYYAEGWVSTPGSGPSDTNWRIYSALGNVSGDSYSLYVNNSLSAGPSNGGSAGPNGIFINSLGEPSTGNFSFVLVYNRILTAAEMTQNYNYFKGRFGL